MHRSSDMFACISHVCAIGSIPELLLTKKVCRKSSDIGISSAFFATVFLKTQIKEYANHNFSADNAVCESKFDFLMPILDDDTYR